MLVRTFNTLKLAVLCSLFIWMNCALAVDWPDIPIPSDAKSFSVADSMEVNGVTMQVYGYFSKQSVKELQAWYQKNTSHTWSIKALGKKQILGTPIDVFYATIQLEATGLESSKAIVSITQVAQVSQGVKNYQQSKLQWLDRLPPGSHIQQLIKSVENGKQALYLQAHNGNSLKLNEAHIIQALKQMGYEPDKFQTRRKNTAPHKGYPKESQGHLIFLNGKNGEAVLAIAQLADGKTAIAINILENESK